MTLYMLQFTPDLPKLVRWAETQLLLHPRAEDDLGYALHALLKAAFDTLTPAPFALLRNPWPSGQTLGVFRASWRSVARSRHHVRRAICGYSHWRAGDGRQANA